MNTRMRRFKKKWTKAFRYRINSFAYRKGSGNEAQLSFTGLGRFFPLVPI